MIRRGPRLAARALHAAMLGLGLPSLLDLQRELTVCCMPAGCIDRAARPARGGAAACRTG
eukprot:SAG31_NODE_65_length_28565_cov_8.402914_12_plen_60_part_00